jgi:MFS family permease
MINAPAMTEITLMLRSNGEQLQGNGYAQGYGWFNVAYATGTLFGPLASAWIVERWGWTILCFSMGTISGLTIIPILLFTGGRPTLETDDDNANDTR